MLFLVRSIAVGVLLALSLLAVFRVPHGALWKPAVAATEFAYVLVPVAVGLAALHPVDGDPWVTALALLAAAVLASPMIRAMLEEPKIIEGFRQGLGVAAAGPIVRLSGLLAPRAPGVVQTRHAYGDGLGLDLYVGPHDGPMPVVVVVHGGSWRNGDSAQLPAICALLASRGTAAVAIDYHLAPEHRFPTQRDDVLAAVEWVRANAEEHGFDPDRIALLGRSAGAQLALVAAYSGAPVRAVVALYAPTDMRWSWEHPSNPWVLNTPEVLGDYLGGAPDELPDRYAEASAMHLVGPSSPPTLLLHGGRDELVYCRQSERLAGRLGELGVRHALVKLPWATHGFDANLGGPGGQIYRWALEGFLAEVLSGTSRRR